MEVVMQIIKPSFFDTFRCIAGSCPDSCCKEWDVLVDPEKAAFYRSLPGQLGDRLRQVLKDEDGLTFMTIENHRCPMWRMDGLCRIQAELGEAALCDTCRDFPRLTHDYGDFTEYGLELSCPEAARIILENPHFSFLIQEVSGGEAPEYDHQDMDILLRTRQQARRILADTHRPVEETLAILLVFAYQAQARLNGLDVAEKSPEDLLASGKSLAKPGQISDILDFFKGLEILTSQWATRLENPCPAPWEAGHLTLARYFVDRYWLQAISDFDLVGRVKMILISCLVIRTLGGQLMQTAQLYSKEIENSIDNVEALLDGAYQERAFTDDRLLGHFLL